VSHKKKVNLALGVDNTLLMKSLNKVRSAVGVYVGPLYLMMFPPVVQRTRSGSFLWTIICTYSHVCFFFGFRQFTWMLPVDGMCWNDVSFLSPMTQAS